jgi:peptide deformylase
VGEVKGEVREQPEGRVDPERELRRRTALAQIRQFGDAALRLRAHEVEEFDGDLVRLAERMRALMVDAQGVGLAANQVGILRRLVVVQPDSEQEALTLVNPRLVERSDDLETDDEGCLSLRGVLAPVERHVSVILEAQDVHGEPLRLDFTGLGARVVQHEIDHLDGVLILDRTDPESRREALGTLRPRPLLQR